MAKPVLLAVDDDPGVLWSVQRDLRQEYGDRFRIIQAESGVEALEAVKKLKQRNEPVALFLVDQRMPQMSGVEFLEEAIRLYPDSKRVLLTAYADTDAAIHAINKVGLDHYLLKPWDPPEERLYPVLNDLLTDWSAHHRPPFEGVTLVGLRWSLKSHRAKDFMARNQVPYRWLDVEASEEANRLLATFDEPPSLPVLFFPDGSFMVDPAPSEIAERVGLHVHAESRFCDLLVIGAGPAGLASAVYGASEGLHTVVIERVAPGGQAGTSSRIENYLGFPVGLSGADLARRAVAQASRFGAEILTPQEVTGIRTRGQFRMVQFPDGTEMAAHAIVIATGVNYRKLDAPGVDALTGAGVYYGAAISEAVSFRGQDVLLVGAGNSAGQAAMYFAKYARSVTMLVRGSLLGRHMSDYLVRQIKGTDNINVRLRTVLVEAHGDDHLEGVTVRNLNTDEKETLSAAALFILIGARPNTEWLAGVVERDSAGFILSGPDLMVDGQRPKGWPLDRDPYLLETSVPGIFVAGDVRHRSVKRVAAAVGEGSMAIQFVHLYLGSL
ncbi:MAG: FAD-dependent oxidoreductase [Anaerolineae bacterium]